MAEINAGGCGVRGFRLDCPIIGQYGKVIQKLDKCTYKRPS
jgi:hypothetical protein